MSQLFVMLQSLLLYFTARYANANYNCLISLKTTSRKKIIHHIEHETLFFYYDPSMMSTIFYLPPQYFIKGIKTLFIIELTPEKFIFYLSIDILHLCVSTIWF